MNQSLFSKQDFEKYLDNRKILRKSDIEQLAKEKNIYRMIAITYNSKT